MAVRPQAKSCCVRRQNFHDFCYAISFANYGDDDQRTTNVKMLKTNGFTEAIGSLPSEESERLLGNDSRGISGRVVNVRNDFRRSALVCRVGDIYSKAAV
jgi:hypothetical protein